MYKTTLAWRERQSDSRFIDSVWSCRALAKASRSVIADPCISIALVSDNDGVRVVLTGPSTKPCRTLLASGYRCTSIRLKPGVFLKRFPAQKLTNNSFIFPADAKSRFKFEDRRLQFPDFDHVELLIDQLYDSGHLGYEMPSSQTPAASHLSPRTHSRQIQRTTGLSPYQLYQLRRMHQALRLLKQGVPAAAVASELAFVDQPHLIRASRQFFGHTPSQLAGLPQTP